MAAKDALYYRPHLETIDREQLQAHQWQRFGTLARRIWPSNTFYRRKWLAAGLQGPGDIASWADFYKLPFTKKQELVLDQAASPPWGTNLTFAVTEYVRMHQTSGTTGRPLRWLDTAEAWRWWCDCWSYVLYGAGVTPADRLFFAFSFGPFVGFFSAFAAARVMGALTITAGGQDTHTRLASIMRNQATVLLCTPSYALHLAEVAEEQGIDLAAGPLNILINAGEPGANIPTTRARIEAAFGAVCHDHTGMTEIGATGFSCVAHQGTHLIESEYIAEVIDPETGEHVPEGAKGELVLTNLGRTGSPLIRYRTGDLVQLSTERCGCGRTFARMLGGVIGRADDMITVRGINIFPSAIEHIIRGYPQIAEFQIEVFKVKGMDEIRLKVEPVPDLLDPALGQMLDRLREELRARLALRVDVAVAEPGSLPRYQMKAKRLIRLS